MAIKVKGGFKSAADQRTTVFITFTSNLARTLMVSLNRSDLASKLRYYLTCCKLGHRFYPKIGDHYVDVTIERAPEPEDIKWTNIGFTDCSTYLRKLFTFTVTIILLGASFAAVYGLSLEQKNNANNRFISIIISLVISIINIVLGRKFCI